MNLGNEAPALCLWCFDLLSLDGVRITPLPLVERKALLSNLVAMIDDKHLQFWGDFPERAAIIEYDGGATRELAERMALQQANKRVKK